MWRNDQIWIDPAYREILRSCQLDHVDAVLSRVDGRVAAWSRTTETVFVACPGFSPGFYVKRYYYPRWRNRLRGALRGTFFGLHRSQFEQRLLTRMRTLGISAVRPVAFGSRRCLHWVEACFLITEGVSGARNLTEAAIEDRRSARPAGAGRRAELARRLAQHVAELHAAGFRHGQLFWRNILLRESVAREPELFLLDARPAWSRGWMRRRDAWIDELAQLAASAIPFSTRSERLRFAFDYFQCRRLTATIKAHLRAIDARAAAWRRHEAQRIHMTGLFSTWAQQLDAETRETAGPLMIAGASAGRREQAD
jgi:hypothetical protein